MKPHTLLPFELWCGLEEGRGRSKTCLSCCGPFGAPVCWCFDAGNDWLFQKWEMELYQLLWQSQNVFTRGLLCVSAPCHAPQGLAKCAPESRSSSWSDFGVYSVFTLAFAQIFPICYAALSCSQSLTSYWLNESLPTWLNPLWRLPLVFPQLVALFSRMTLWTPIRMFSITVYLHRSPLQTVRLLKAKWMVWNKCCGK